MTHSDRYYAMKEVKELLEDATHVLHNALLDEDDPELDSSGEIHTFGSIMQRVSEIRSKFNLY